MSYIFEALSAYNVYKFCMTIPPQYSACRQTLLRERGLNYNWTFTYDPALPLLTL